MITQRYEDENNKTVTSDIICDINLTEYAFKMK